MKIKYLFIIALSALCTLSMTSCGEKLGGPNTSAGGSQVTPDEPDKPNEPDEPSEPDEPDEPIGDLADAPDPSDLANLGNLYPLRKYVNSAELPGFRLGAAASIPDFNNKKTIYDLVTKNFDQVVATYHMKHEAVVQSSGGYNFGNVDKFVNMCDAAGVEVYGHTLCWYRSNNINYLNSVVAKAKASTSDAAKQKKAIDTAVTNAMEQWVKAMMEHTPNVTDWDVINETISDKAPYGMRRGDGSTPSGGIFYWVDYMGDDYGRDVIYFARKYAKKKLKLFINDYGLEWKHTQFGKLYALIELIKEWESDGITKVDGIGSQMHLDYSVVEGTQNYYRNEVKTMFEIMATSGKLIKVSELDITLKDEDGKYITPEETTPEQHQMLADYYEFILKCYFEILPVEQQYGITHWSLVDASKNDTYRYGPVGLWDLQSQRKPEYAGFVKGLYNMWE